MSITLNRVGVEIDGKVYNFYKLSFGFQRRLIEVQSSLDKLQNDIAKKYNIDIADVANSDKVSASEKLEIARAGLDIQEAMKSLFVNPEESAILDNFTADNVTELINALK